VRPDAMEKEMRPPAMTEGKRSKLKYRPLEHALQKGSVHYEKKKEGCFEGEEGPTYRFLPDQRGELAALLRHAGPQVAMQGGSDSSPPIRKRGSGGSHAFHLRKESALTPLIEYKRKERGEGVRNSDCDGVEGGRKKKETPQGKQPRVSKGRKGEKRP